jgi:hypothetical protein
LCKRCLTLLVSIRSGLCWNTPHTIANAWVVDLFPAILISSWLLVCHSQLQTSQGKYFKEWWTV